MSGATAGGLTGIIPPDPKTGNTGLYTAQGTSTTGPDLVRTGLYQFNTSDGSAAAAAAVGFKNGTFYVFRL